MRVPVEARPAGGAGRDRADPARERRRRRRPGQQGLRTNLPDNRWEQTVQVPSCRTEWVKPMTAPSRSAMRPIKGRSGIEEAAPGGLGDLFGNRRRGRSGNSPSQRRRQAGSIRGPELTDGDAGSGLHARGARWYRARSSWSRHRPPASASIRAPGPRNPSRGFRSSSDCSR